MISYFPPELLPQILLSLPVRSIVTCTCVCKLWYNLIKDSNFLTTHLRKTFDSIKNNKDHDNQLLLVRPYFDSQERYSLYIDKGEELKEYTKLNVPNFMSRRKCRIIVGSCNGLICYVDNIDHNIFFLWNPMTEKVLNVPKLNLYKSNLRNTFMVGFGFDYCSNDYKILRIVQDGCRCDCLRIELFSVKEGYWINVTSRPQIEIIWRSSLAFVNGIMHCIGFRKLADGIFDNVILGFDVSKREFFEIMLPPSLQNVHPQSLSIIVYKDLSVAVVKITSSGRQIWVMKDYGTVESWTELNIVGETKILRVLGFRRNGEFLFQSYKDGIFSFDPESKQVKHYGIHHRGSIFVVSYMESLALLDIETNNGATNYKMGPIISTKKMKEDLQAFLQSILDRGAVCEQ